MVRVLHFVSNAQRSRYLNVVAELSSRDQFALTVGTLSAAGSLQDDMRASGVSTMALGCTDRAQYPMAAVRLARWLRKEQIDIVQTHLFDASFVGLLAARFARTPLAVLTRHHADAVIMTGNRRAIWLDRLMSRYLAMRIIAASEKVREVIISQEKVSGLKIVVVPYGFDFASLRPTEGARARIRNELGLEGATVLAAVGRLDPLKGLPLLIRAVGQVRGDFPALRLLIVGEGPERQRLERLRDELGLRSHVIMTGFRSDVCDMLAAADVFVHPSLTEAFSQVIAEAAALEKPIVATQVGGASEAIEEGVSGLIVTPGDCEGLADALRQVLRCRDEWPAMGAAGRRRVLQFSSSRMVSRYETYYANWLSEVKGRTSCRL